jgi:hypothetical protein
MDKGATVQVEQSQRRSAGITGIEPEYADSFLVPITELEFFLQSLGRQRGAGLAIRSDTFLKSAGFIFVRR